MVQVTTHELGSPQYSCHFILLFLYIFFFFYSPGPGSLQSLENTTSNSTIHLKFKEPVDKNAEMITYIVNVSFSYKLLCGQMRAGTDIWKSMTNTDGSKLTFTKLKSYSVYNVRAWASTSAGAGPVSETLAYTKHGGEYYFFCG